MLPDILAPLSERGARLMQEFPALEVLRKHDRRGVNELIRGVERADEFNRRYAEPIALQLDERIGRDPDYFNHDILKAGCQYRFLSVAIPKGVGGTAGRYTVTPTTLAVYELCSTCGGIGLLFGAHTLGVSPLITAGSMAHWDTVLHEIAEEEKKGNPVLMAYAITEPSAGTDVEDPAFLKQGKVGMEARKVKGGYLLNGTKCFISNGREAKYLTLTAATDRRRPLETWTTFLIEKDMPGYTAPRVERKMGQRASHATELHFEDVFVPDSHVLGYPGDGMTNGILMVMGASRGPVGAISTGIATGAYNHFLAWARTPKNGHKPIDEERIRMAAADMHAMLAQNRSLFINHALVADAYFGPLLGGPIVRSTYLIPRAIRTSKPYAGVLNSKAGKAFINTLLRAFVPDEAMTHILALASMAKFACSDNAMKITSTALQLMGADPCEDRRWVEKCFRDAKLCQIYEGTNQLNRLCVHDTEIANELTVEMCRAFKPKQEVTV
ncbi:MAG: acyl-CoA dehydrogenase family protein [Candidatus Geothermincolia bacterium]